MMDYVAPHTCSECLQICHCFEETCTHCMDRRRAPVEHFCTDCREFYPCTGGTCGPDNRCIHDCVRESPKYGTMIMPPMTVKDDLSVPADLPIVKVVCGRVGQEVFNNDRGNYDYVLKDDMFVLHLKLTDKDRAAAQPFLYNVDEVWVGVHGRTNTGMID